MLLIDRCPECWHDWPDHGPDGCDPASDDRDEWCECTLTGKPED